MWIRYYALVAIFALWGHADAQGPNIRLEKQVSKDSGQTYFDADTQGEALVAGAGDAATYRFIVTNTGTVVLTGVLLSDSNLGLNEPIGDLAAGELAQYIADPVNNICTAAGLVINTATVVATEVGGVQQQVSDTNPAHVQCDISCELEVDKKCQVQGDGSNGSNNIKYIYEIMNTGTTDIGSLSVVDDKLGDLDAPSSITAGTTETFEVETRITEDTTNAVVVSGDNGECLATDSVFAAVEVCGVCEGKVNELTLQYNGVMSSVTVTVKHDDTVFPPISPGDEITVQRIKGNKITVFVDGVKDADIKTGCNNELGPGSVVGSFTVLSGTSDSLLPLCPIVIPTADACVVPLRGN